MIYIWTPPNPVTTKPSKGTRVYNSGREEVAAARMCLNPRWDAFLHQVQNCRVKHQRNVRSYVELDII